ncbi:MAG: hypothetical protein ACRDAM_12370, partial [Casimicrobium sp.]
MALLCLASNSLAQPHGSAGQQTAVPKTQIATLNIPALHYGYYEYLPIDYNHTGVQKFGLMLSLHGSGERGSGALPSLRKVIWGSNENVNANPQWPAGLINQGRSYPLIVLSPQCSNSEGTGDCGWWEGERLRRFIEAAIASYN